MTIHPATYTRVKENNEIKLDQDKIKVKFDLEGIEGVVEIFLAKGKTFIFNKT
ncbi:MAG: hypothetical protein ACPKPY_10695 [Nitrososphaeraceae archaeon]